MPAVDNHMKVLIIFLFEQLGEKNTQNTKYKVLAKKTVVLYDVFKQL